MKKCCKNVNILADDFIEDSIYEALDEKWKRSDVAKYLHGRTSSMSLQAMKRLLRDTDERNLMVSGLVHTVAESLRYEIQNRCLKVEPIQYSWRQDGVNGKIREIGVESVKQLILDEIASEGLDELWRRKLGYHQYASIKGKGQLGGKKAIEHQIRKKYSMSRYAWKGDVKKCYPSVDTRKLKRMLEHDVKNEVLLYLVYFLIGTYKQGLNIGSGLSQFLCNYYLAKAYVYVLGLAKEVHRRGQNRRCRQEYRRKYMEAEYISRSEHEEFCKRIDAENGRQNKRLELLEGNTKQINSLTTSVEKLAQSIQLMCKEQEQQGARLESLESRDGEMWKQVTGYVLTTLIGLAIGFFFKQFGL